ncbi:MAG TPA: HlyD family efflux transporter periplasmic adaptor subunit [Pyrinomonadaceae bacterium]|nr:HlyD family efflux transporter periplasmic adaptor subunit [Pyrinomonadaceae bacterium]
MSDTTENKTEQQGQPSRRSRAAFIAPRAVALLLIAGTVGGAIWYFLLRTPASDPNVIRLSGRIEGDDAAVSAKVSGRIREISVREGDQVKAGQIIAIIDDEQVRAREEQERSLVQQAEARVMSARQQIAVLNAQLEQSNIGVDQARLDAEGRVNQAEAQVAQAEAQLVQAEASFNQARYDEERYTTLAGDGDVPERTGRQARSTAETQAAAVQAARRQVDAARAALKIAKANLANAAMRTSQSVAIRQQIIQAEADITAAEAETEKARARLREAEADRNDLQIAAPFDGTVATRTAEPGEVVTAGTPVVTLVNLSTVYLRGFIPEGQIGRVRTGQAARVYLDSAPSEPIEAIVIRIDPEASFTPENTYFQDDRVKQVVGVKLQLKGATGFAKPGMPADGEVITGGNQLTAEVR